MNHEQLHQRAESLKNDIDKVQNGMQMLRNQLEQMNAQFHMLNGHLHEVKYQLECANAPGVVATVEDAPHGEAHCEEAQQSPE